MRAPRHCWTSQQTSQAREFLHYKHMAIFFSEDWNTFHCKAHAKPCRKNTCYHSSWEFTFHQYPRQAHWENSNPTVGFNCKAKQNKSHHLQIHKTFVISCFLQLHPVIINGNDFPDINADFGMLLNWLQENQASFLPSCFLHSRRYPKGVWQQYVK